MFGGEFQVDRSATTKRSTTRTAQSIKKQNDQLPLTIRRNIGRNWIGGCASKIWLTAVSYFIFIIYFGTSDDLNTRCSFFSMRSYVVNNDCGLLLLELHANTKPVYQRPLWLETMTDGRTTSRSERERSRQHSTIRERYL